MFIEKVVYKHGTVIDGLANVMPEISRIKYMTTEFIKYHGKELFDVDNDSSTALLYAAGPATHCSDSRNSKHTELSGNIVVKGQIGYKVNIIGNKFKNIDYLSINADTCSSSMQAIHTAKSLIEEFEHIIIYSENIASELELKFFEQLGVDLICCDGVAMIHITRDKTPNSKAEIVDTAWCWNGEISPMTVSEKGYLKVINKINTDGITHIKPHGTGTTSNDNAEDTALNSLFPGVPVLKYKQEIGHSQGASTAIEVGMLLDREEDFDALVLASGLGNFYGACRIKSL